MIGLFIITCESRIAEGHPRFIISAILNLYSEIDIRKPLVAVFDNDQPLLELLLELLPVVSPQTKDIMIS